MTITWLGTPKKFGMLGQLGQVSPDVLFSIQAFLNDALSEVQRLGQQVGRAPIRTDGLLDRATCEALFAWSRGEFGALDPTLRQLVEENIAELQPACSALSTGTTPPPPPPAPEPPQSEFEQCFIEIGSRSAAIRSIQQQVNVRLRAASRSEIAVSGVYDEITCRAVLVAEQLGGPEWVIPECPGGVTYPTSCPGISAPSSATASKGGGGGLVFLAVAALAAVVAATQLG